MSILIDLIEIYLNNLFTFFHKIVYPICPNDVETLSVPSSVIDPD